jgi:hypothetical protein
MGIPMDDIHTPTVAAGPTSAPSGSDGDVSALSLSGLFNEKERLEAELKALSRVLESVSTSGCLNHGFDSMYATRTIYILY